MKLAIARGSRSKFGLPFWLLKIAGVKLPALGCYPTNDRQASTPGLAAMNQSGGCRFTACAVRWDRVLRSRCQNAADAMARLLEESSAAGAVAGTGRGGVRPSQPTEIQCDGDEVHSSPGMPTARDQPTSPLTESPVRSAHRGHGLRRQLGHLGAVQSAARAIKSREFGQEFEPLPGSLPMFHP